MTLKLNCLKVKGLKLGHVTIFSLEFYLVEVVLGFIHTEHLLLASRMHSFEPYMLASNALFSGRTRTSQTGGGGEGANPKGRSTSLLFWPNCMICGSPEPRIQIEIFVSDSDLDTCNS